MRRRAIGVILLAWLAYILSYLGRANYNACVLEIVTTVGAERSLAGMVSSVLSIFYAIGQLTSGFILKRFSPVPVVGVELLAVSLINLLFPNVGGFGAMALLWALNGCVQSTLLTSLTRLFVENLEEPYLSKSAVVINTVGAVGGVTNYLLTWLLLKYANWQSVFFVSSGCLFLFCVVWMIFMPRLTSHKEEGHTKEWLKKQEIMHSHDRDSLSVTIKNLGRHLKRHGAVFALTGCFTVGILREGVLLWSPSYINDTFTLGTAMSTVMTVFVPMVQICGAMLAGRINSRIYNLHFPAAVLFGLSGLSLLLLPILGRVALGFTLLLFVVNAVSLTTCLTCYLSMFPLRFFAPEETPLITGVSNFCTHVGEFFATIGIGWLSEKLSWTPTFILLAMIGGIALVCSALGGYNLQRREKLKRQTG